MEMEATKIAQKLYQDFEDNLAVTYRDKNVALSKNEQWITIQQQSKEIRELISLLAMEKLIDRNDKRYDYKVIRRKVFKAEFNKKKIPSQNGLLKFFTLLPKTQFLYQLSTTDVLFCFSYYKETFGKDEHYQKARNFLIKRWKETSYPETSFRKLINGIQKLDIADNELAKIFNPSDILGKYFMEHWENYDPPFHEIIKLCWSQPQKSSPSKTWTKNAIQQIQKNKVKTEHIKWLVEILSFVNEKGKSVISWLNGIPTGTIEDVNPLWTKACKLFNDSTEQYYLLEENEIGVSYLIWFASLYNDERLNGIIGEFAETSSKKIKWLIGPLSTKNTNATLYGFTLMPAKIGITNLLKIKNKTKNKNTRKLIDNHIKRKAKALNLTPESLLEISVPTFNLKGNLAAVKFTEYTGIIDVSKISKPISYWVNNKTEKQQKAVPAAIKENSKAELKIFKAKLKDIAAAFQVHSKRLENAYLDNIVWTTKEWQDYYVKHPFLSRFGSKLIWIFDDKKTGIIANDELIDFNGNNLALADFSEVKLWHPIYSEVKIVQNWRNFILEQEIKQPFKQAYREIYKITDAEIGTSTYSNRFAAHILYQHQFNALARIRNWQYKLQGGFDSHNVPTKLIPKYNLKAEYWVTPIQDSLNDANIYTYVASDQVRIYDNINQLEMQNIPEILFTEIMRDVDLFVGVCSIGNNFEWEDSGATGNYWNSYSFGDLSPVGEMRKTVLEKILPKLKIKNKCSIEGKYLIVEGTIRNYKIHLGSGNILMSPNDEYLCIVPNAKSKQSKIFLPFDNDRTLSIILSKAILLSKDDKIKDPTILRQIKF